VVTGLATLDDCDLDESGERMSFLPAVLNGRWPIRTKVLAPRAVHELFESCATVRLCLCRPATLTPAVDVRATGHFVQQYVLVMNGKNRVDAVEER